MASSNKKVALVTGGARGIGLGIARRLAEAGFNLAVMGRREAAEVNTALEELRTQGAEVLYCQADVADADGRQKMVDATGTQFGRLDVLVNNAGVEDWMTFDQLAVELIDEAIDVNLRAPVVLSRLLLPRMRERGRGHIVNIASLAGLGPVAYAEPYCLTKHGLIGFTRSLRATVRNENYPVSCSVVCPGLVDAGMYEDATRDFGVKAPLALGSSPPGRVARAVVRAVKRDLPEIIVNPIPYRLPLAIGLLAPRLAQWMVQWLGISKFFGIIARQRGRQAH